MVRKGGDMSTQYIRQFRSHPRHRWYSPLLVIALAGLFYGVGLIVQFGGFFIWALVYVEGAGGAGGSGGDFDAFADSMVDFNTVNGMVNGLISVILMWPAVELATRMVYRRWFWSMISIGRGLRWSLLGRYVLLALPVWVIAALVMIVLSPGAMGDLASGLAWSPHMAAMLVAVLVLVPFQAAAEEVVFRGLAMNVIGSWLRHPAWAVLIPVPFFVFGHLYDVPGLIDVGIFAVVVGALTLFTGGLEAGMAFHIVNNIFALGLGVLSGADLNATSGPTIETLISIAAPIVFAGVVILDARRRPRGDAERVAQPAGSVASTSKPPAAVGPTCSVPSSASTRSRMPLRPNPPPRWPAAD